MQRFHLLINGEPLCVWTGCIAHRSYMIKSRVQFCDYDALDKAADAASSLLKAGVRDVAVAFSACPVLEGFQGERRAS